MRRPGLLRAGLAAALLTLAMSLPAHAAPKSGPNGESCVSSGTVRRDGRDDQGNKVNCEWDFCTYCDQGNGQINCSVQKTSYSNPRDCRAAASTRPGGSLRPPVAPETLAPPDPPPPSGPGPLSPGGMRQRMQQR